METLQKQLNPWLTTEQVEEIRLKYTTLPTDENGFVKGVIYGSPMVRNDITKLVAEVKRLRAIEQALQDFFQPNASAQDVFDWLESTTGYRGADEE